MSALRIFVADDHEMIRRVIAALLGAHSGWEICGEAANGQEAVEKVAELNPDIVLMDIDMPGLGGLEATRRIVQNHPSRKVIVLTMTATEEAVRGVFRAGALGFVNKPNATHDLVAAIEAVQRGRTFFTARFAETVLKSYLEEEKLQGANEPELTERERITIRLLTDEMNMTAAQQWRKPKVTGKAARYAAILLIVLTVSGVGWWVLNGEPEHAPPVLEKLFVSLGLKPSQVSLVNGNPDAKVWIDVHTALYFCAGSESFGKTQKGRLAKQREAQLDHFEPASGKPCD